jgi:hypothetical protein
MSGRDEAVAALQAAKAGTPPPALANVPPITLPEVVEVFERWLYLPDTVPLYATLGTAAAMLLPGDPVWLLVVGPPGDGKTELVNATTRLPKTHLAATLTEAALLSGTALKERAKGAKGGLLRSIGDEGSLVLKDFGSVLSMNRDSRASLLAALREVYDGSWTRHVGVDGGTMLHWQGRLGLLAGCTQMIDRHHAAMGALGERFVLLRTREVDCDQQARRALAHSGKEGRMRAELQRAVSGLLGNGLPNQPRDISPEEVDGLIQLATLVVRCRSAIERDNYSREIELVPRAEAPTRLVGVLARLLAALDAIGLERGQAWKVINRVGLDSMPALRRSCLEVLLKHGEVSTTGVAEAVRYPTQTTRRSLEDLTAHDVICRISHGSGKSDTWKLSDWAQPRCERTFPEMSGGVLSGTGTVPEMSVGMESAKAGETLFSSPFPTYDDKSGKVPNGSESSPATESVEGEGSAAEIPPPTPITARSSARRCICRKPARGLDGRCTQCGDVAA